MPFSPRSSVPSGPLGGWRQRLPWFALSAALIVLVTVMTWVQPLPRIDRLLQVAPLWAVPRTASPEIVLVTIDDKSIEAIGQWPWRRALHAELLQRIGAGQPRCIGLDLMLTGSDRSHPNDDALLAQRMREQGCVVLPMALQARPSGSPYQAELLPAPVFVQAAAALGRVHLLVDEDGVVRSFQRLAGFPGRPWPHFAEAVQLAAQAQPMAGGARSFPAIVQPDASWEASSPPEGSWQWQGREVLRFADPSRPFTSYSYIDVLQGHVPAAAFKNRYVLVGAVAGGMSDAYATPAPGARALMPGIEIFANLLQSLIQGEHVSPATTWQNLVFNLTPLLIALVALLWLRPLSMGLLIIALLALRVAVQAAQPWTHVQFAPAAGFIGLLLVHPTWSLLRLMAALRFLRRETAQLFSQIGGTMLPSSRPASAGDVLDRQMAATAAMLEHVRNLHRFVRDGVDHLPDATLVLNRRGRIFIANEAAGMYWQRPSAELIGQDAHALLEGIRSSQTSTPMITPGAFATSHGAPITGEGRDGQGRTVLLRCVPFFDAGDTYAGWMVSLVDISTVRHTQNQRDEALRFISHDIREPSASILTVIELARAQPAMLPRDLMLQRIERHARTGLQLADGFVNLARTEAHPLKMELLDLVDLLSQAIDNAWAEARARQAHVRLLDDAPEEALCIADRTLLSRAFTNVIGNAIKYSPPGGEVRCRVSDRGTHWAISVQDQGPGIPEDLQPQLFQPFHRLHRESHPEVHGIGLGLLQVRTAMQRHGGTVEIDSAENAGCTVILVLPKPTASTLEVLR